MEKVTADSQANPRQLQLHPINIIFLQYSLGCIWLHSLSLFDHQPGASACNSQCETLIADINDYITMRAYWRAEKTQTG